MNKNQFIENAKYYIANKIYNNLENILSKVNSNKNIRITLWRFATEERAVYYGTIYSDFNNRKIHYDINIEFDTELKKLLNKTDIKCRFNLIVDEYDFSIEKEFIIPNIDTMDVFAEPLKELVDFAKGKLDFVNVKPLTSNDLAKTVIEALKKEDQDNNTGILWDKFYYTDSEISDYPDQKFFKIRLRSINPMKNIGFKLVLQDKYDDFTLDDITDLSKVKYMVFDIIFYCKDREVHLFELPTEDLLFGNGASAIYWHIQKIKKLLAS